MTNQSHTPTPSGPDFNVGQHADKVAEAYESTQENLRAIGDAIDQQQQTIDALVAALRRIATIENSLHGDDWCEIEAARTIARAALAAAESK